MTIQLKKFGTVLTSRPSGKEALAAFVPYLENVKSDETVVIDFDGVLVLSPSWADEFILHLRERFHDRLVFVNINNPSVQATLKFLQLLNNT